VLEELEVEPLGLDHPDADEVLFELLQLLVGPHHLRVQASAGRTRHTAKHHKDRFARLPGLGQRFGQIVVNPVRRDVGVLEGLLQLGLTPQGGAQSPHATEHQEQPPEPLHGPISHKSSTRCYLEGTIFGRSATILSMAGSASSPFLKAWLALTAYLWYST